MNPKFISMLIIFIMALIDVFALFMIKAIYQEKYAFKWMFLPIFIYAMQPLLFYYVLHYTNVTVANIMWDLTSDILVTFVGLYIIKEKISPQSKIGLIFAVIAIYFFTRGQLEVS